MFLRGRCAGPVLIAHLVPPGDSKKTELVMGRAGSSMVTDTEK